MTPQECIGAMRGGQVVRVERGEFRRFFRKTGYDADAFEGLGLRRRAFCWRREFDATGVKRIIRANLKNGATAVAGQYQTVWPAKYRGGRDGR